MSGTTRTKLRKAGEHLRTVEEQYNADLRAQDPSEDLRYAVGRVIGDLREVLDSLACEAAEVLGNTKPGWSPSFPTWTARTDFERQMREDFPSLGDEHPALWEAIERQQPWHGEKAELRHLRPLAKVEVHRHFSAQTRTEVVRSVITAPGGAQLRFREMGADGIGVRATGAGTILFNGQPLSNTLQPLPGSTLQAERTIYVDWLFADLGIPVLGTLQALQRIVTEAEADITATLPG